VAVRCATGAILYIYQNSQVLDYVLVYLHPPLSVTDVSSRPINADYPVTFNRVDGSFHRSSDHDPLLVKVGWMDTLNYLPFVGR
jgi:predicted extracellular nuclease